MSREPGAIQLVVIAHQAVGVGFDPEALSDLRQQHQEQLVVARFAKHRAPAGPSVHHVVPSAAELDA